MPAAMMPPLIRCLFRFRHYATCYYYAFIITFFAIFLSLLLLTFADTLLLSLDIAIAADIDITPYML